MKLISMGHPVAACHCHHRPSFFIPAALHFPCTLPFPHGCMTENLLSETVVQFPSQSYSTLWEILP